MFWTRPLQPLTLIAILMVATGCQTTVGNYLANRGRDFGESFRVQVGAGPGIGVSVAGAGLAHVGLSVAMVPRVAGIGWAYGEGYSFGLGAAGNTWDTEVDYSVIVPAFVAAVAAVVSKGKGHGGTRLVWYPIPTTRRGRISGTSARGGRISGTSAFHWQQEAVSQPSLNGRLSDHSCYCILPCVLSRVSRKARPKAGVHAFDVETRVYAGIVYAKAGFSPGEFLDFFLGWFGVDIAGDDRGLEQNERQGGGVGED
ncbi:MAG: hypothetical protein O7H41_08660 [Planctomycetota bacterium]|nr:hypothetical protein [Planctomycetota bacterium]